MNATLQRTHDYLERMLEATERVEKHTTGLDRDAFDADLRTQDAVIRNPEVIGEAARNILRHDPAFASAHPALPLGKAYQMRNTLSHGYADEDLDTVWRTVQTSLPPLETQLKALLKPDQGAVP